MTANQNRIKSEVADIQGCIFEQCERLYNLRRQRLSKEDKKLLELSEKNLWQSHNRLEKFFKVKK